jgi:hypothetical protein
MEKRVANDATNSAPASRPTYDRRIAPREPAQLPAILVAANAREIPCMIVDRSEEGFRLRIAGDEAIPDHFHLVDLLTGVGHEARVAWRDLPMVGSRSLRSYDLHVPQQGIGATLQRIWTAALT